MRLDRSDFKREEKKLKKYIKECENYNKIIRHIKTCEDFKTLKNSPLSYIYGFEQLRHFSENYYSFNLSKNGGMIRLIFQISEEENTVKLIFISTKHYEDFNRKVFG